MESTVLYYQRRQKDETITFSNRRTRSERRVANQPVTLERRREASHLRTSEREEFEIPVHFEATMKEIVGETRNINLGGLMVCSDVPISSGTSIKLRFSFAESLSLDLGGQVIFCRPAGAQAPGWAIGVAFAKMGDLEQGVLESAIQAVNQREAQKRTSLTIFFSENILEKTETLPHSFPESDKEEPMGHLQTMNHVDTKQGKPLTHRESFYSTLRESNRSLKQWAGRYTYFRRVDSAGTQILSHGQQLILLTSNDHLGLTQHPRVKDAALRAIERYGTGSGSTHVLAGTIDLHKELEERLAKFKRLESAILFATGYMANLGAISTLFRQDYVLVNDSKNHYSIFEGCRASKSQIRIYRHNDMGHLEQVLKLYSKKRKVIITDSVFSMDGDMAPLKEITALAQKYDALVVVDEVFASGVLGEQGRGSLSHFGIEGQVDLITDSFGKAFASFGGYVAGSSDMINYLRHFAMPSIFTTSLSPVVSATVLAALDVMESDADLIPKLWTNIEYMRKGLEEIGLNLGKSTTQIIPVMIGDEAQAHRVAAALQERGVFVSAIGRPAVPRGEARLRVSPMATHTREELDQALVAFKDVGEKFNLIC